MQKKAYKNTSSEKTGRIVRQDRKRTLYANLSDEELVRLIRANDEEAVNSLMSKYKKAVRMRAAAYYMTGADREDLIQEGMIGLFKAIRDFDENRGISFVTFANLCIQRQIISAIRGAARMKHLPLNNYVSLSDPFSTDEDNGETRTLEETLIDNKSEDPEYMLLMREKLEYIEVRLDELLTEMERTIWSMYIRGSSYKEIAERLDKTDKAVDNAIRRAKKKLTELLDDDNFVDSKSKSD